MRIHHVDVYEIDEILHQLYLIGQMGEVRREDRRGQLGGHVGRIVSP